MLITLYRTQHIDVNFDIDMRKFANFKLHQQNLEQIQEIPENGSPDRVILTEELVCDNQAIFVISNTISKFLQGGFQLEFESISQVINHMTCYKFECPHCTLLVLIDFCPV